MDPTKQLQDAFTLVGRALLAWLFISNGFEQAMNFSGTAGWVASQGVPMAEAATAVSLLAHLVPGLMLLAGWQARWAALALAAFTLVITPIFHHYWSMPPAQVTVQKIMFYKNLAIIGGLLGIVAFGPGGWSLDARRNRT